MHLCAQAQYTLLRARTTPDRTLVLARACGLAGLTTSQKTKFIRKLQLAEGLQKRTKKLHPNEPYKNHSESNTKFLHLFDEPQSYPFCDKRWALFSPT